jgi:hypothetical protein
LHHVEDTTCLLGDAAAVAVGPKDEVDLFNRAAHPMIVLDRDGNFLRSWGAGVFKNPHGLHIGPDGHVYCPTMATIPCANARRRAASC